MKYFIFLLFFSVAFNAFAEGDDDLYLQKDLELADEIFPRTDPYRIGDIYQILKVMDKVFKKNKIYYWIDFGTLLGAERHGGIIPWDDDADICIFAGDINNVANLENIFARYGLVLWKRHPLPWVLHFPGQQNYGVDFFFQWDVPNSPNGELTFQSDWTGHWYRNEVESYRRVAFGPLMLNAPSLPWRRLHKQYGDDCMEKATYHTHMRGDLPYKVKVVDFKPAQYLIDPNHKIIKLD